LTHKFLRLQLQNILALGTVVNSEAYSCTKLRNIWLFNFRDDILISILITTVESNLRTS